MPHSPVYVHFRSQWQLLTSQGLELRLDRDVLSELWTKLNSKLPDGGYDKFDFAGNRCEMVTPRGETQGRGPSFSKLICAGNEVAIVEEWSQCSSPEFLDKCKDVMKIWFDCFPATLAVVQRVWVRALVEPVTEQDSREFIGNRMLKLTDTMQETFKEMPHQVGFTIGLVRKFPKFQLHLDIKVQSWRDNRSIWIEVMGAAPLNPPINATKPEACGAVIEKVIEALESEVMGLIHKYDQEEEET